VEPRELFTMTGSPGSYQMPTLAYPISSEIGGRAVWAGGLGYGAAYGPPRRPLSTVHDEPIGIVAARWVPVNGYARAVGPLAARLIEPVL